MRELSVLNDPANEDSTKIKQKICILDHPKNLIEVLRARLAIGQGITGNNITTGPSQYCFTRTSLAGKELRILDFKSTELRHETVANLTRSHKAMLISQGFNTETGDLETFVEHCK